jgi:geranylgeranyl diphosphate synthase type I
VSEPRIAEPRVDPPALERVRARVDEVLEEFLRDRRAELVAMDPAAAGLVEEIGRLLDAGGKRIRPALCYWAFVASAGSDGRPILRACAAVELLHTCALVHDDVIDRDQERRGVDATHVRFAKKAPVGADPDAFGTAAAILVGDLALVLSELLMRTSGFGQDVLAPAMSRFDRMRLEMAAGQFLDVSGAGDPARVSALKSASYTTEGPVLVGAALAGAGAAAGAAAEGALRVYARLVGRAFQLRDDVLDGDAPADAVREIDSLLSRAADALDGASLRPSGVGALVQLANHLRLAQAP